MVEGAPETSKWHFDDYGIYFIPFHLSHISKQLNIKSYILISKSIIIFILNQNNLWIWEL